MPIQTRTLGSSVGVEITGVDLSTDISPADEAAIREAWLGGLVAVFPGQNLDTDAQIAFAKRFGDLQAPRTAKDSSDDKPVMYIANRKVDGKDGALPDGEMQFHMDQCYYENPPMATFLYGIEVPKTGGNTLFASGYRAYEALDADLQKRLRGLTALQAYDHYNGGATQRVRQVSPDAPQFEHPVVAEHPETGRPVLFVNRLMTVKLVGLPDEESADLLDHLFDVIEDASEIYSHQWTPGDLVVWDNRCAFHARTDFDPAEARVMRRLTVKGVRPKPAALAA